MMVAFHPQTMAHSAIETKMPHWSRDCAWFPWGWLGAAWFMAQADEAKQTSVRVMRGTFPRMAWGG